MCKICIKLAHCSAEISSNSPPKKKPKRKGLHRTILVSTPYRLTFTAVSRVISFPIRSTSTGRHARNSAPRLSPNVEMTSPMQEIAHSLTSCRTRNIREKQKQKRTLLMIFTDLVLILVCQA